MTQELTSVSALFSTPYLTNDEYREAPTSVDIDDFVGGGSMALNDVELGNVIARASSWIDSHCGQVLAATLDTDSFRARVSRDGMLNMHPRYWPIVAVESASFGSNPTVMNTLDPTTAWIEPMAVVFPMLGLNASFLGQIQFSRTYSPSAVQYCTMTYVNGYANTLLAANSIVGATSLSVKDRTGFVAGSRFNIYDGVNTELLTIASNHTHATGPGTLPLASAATCAHTTGVSVSALPPAIKQACIYMTNVILKSRGNSALVMESITPTRIVGDNPNVSSDYNSAVDLLKPFRRIR
jgi:hypothetical protein